MVSETGEVHPSIGEALEDDERIALDIGGGRQPEPDHINVDLRDAPEVDIVAPADDLPVSDAVVSRIHANSLVPHLEDPFDTFAEWARVLESGGELIVKATHANSTGIRDDADHSFYSWTSETPEYFSGDMFGYYSDAESLRLESCTVVGWLRPEREWLRPPSWAFGQLIEFVENDMADELMKLPLAGGRVIARFRKT